MSSSEEDLMRIYRDTVGHFATGVTIVTASGPHGPAGMTTNAVTSVSLDPLLLLVCFDHSSRTLDVVRESGRFAVNVLGVGDEKLAAVFASKAVALEKFEAITGQLPGPGWSEAHGIPVLDSALAWIVCDVRELRDAGDHTIGIGEVVGMASGAERDPLVWYRGRYTTIAES
ncbi:MAG: flavin reductase family protein, partial [Actinomycetota bacterium]|nr:flavin reductase family protein [Actinomycetota bacterium]